MKCKVIIFVNQRFLCYKRLKNFFWWPVAFFRFFATPDLAAVSAAAHAAGAAHGATAAAAEAEDERLMTSSKVL